MNNKLGNIIIVTFLIFLSRVGQSQRIGINTQNPEISSVLDIQSDSLGILIPRLDSLNIRSISDPAQSLLVFQTDGQQGYYYFDGNIWKNLSNSNINIELIDPQKVPQDSITSYILSQSNVISTFYHYDSIHLHKGVWFWNTEKLLPFNVNNNQEIRTYNSYLSFRSDTLTSYYPEFILIRDFITKLDTNEYITRGGLFFRDTIGVENGGTTLVNSKNIIYKRKWDGVNISPSWWQIGGYDAQGRIYENDFLWQGIETNGDRLWAAADFASKGMRIICEPNSLYETSHIIMLNNNVSLIGNGSVIKRGNTSSILKSASIAGTKIYHVEDPDKFRIGMQINAFGDINVYGDQSHGIPRFSMFVQDIMGENIILTKNVDNTISEGNKVMSTLDMIRCLDQNTIQDLVLDGNSSELDATYSWNHANGIVYFSKGGLKVDRCIFRNFFSDVIIGPSPLYVYDSEFLNIAGACVHGSDDDLESSSSIHYNKAGVYILNCKFSNICFATASANGHANQMGIYAQSIGSGNIIIDKCYAENGNNGGIVTPINRSSDHIKISNSYFKDLGHILSNTSTEGIRGLDIRGNVFENCGVLNFEGSPNSFGKYSETDISNNRFLNCQFVLYGSDRLNFSNNNILYSPNESFENLNSSKEVFSNSNRGLLSISSSNSVVTDNIIISNTFDERASAGIYIRNRTNDSFENFRLSGNTVIGFPKGIEGFIVGNNTIRKNILIDNNFVETGNYIDSVPSYGIQVGNGAKVRSNHVVHNDNSPALRIYGTIELNNEQASSWVTNNICEGNSYEKQIELLLNNSAVNNNYLTGKIYQQSESDTNFIGLNHHLDIIKGNFSLNLENQVNIETGDGPPQDSEKKGSAYIDILTGDWYIYKEDLWVKLDN
jgi:hypothetical protein